MPPHTRSKTRALANPLADIELLMGQMNIAEKTPKTKKTKKPVASEDMLSSMLSGLTIGKTMKSKSRRRRYTRRKTHKPKMHTTGGRRRPKTRY